LAPYFSLRSQVIAGHDHSSNKRSVFLISHLDTTVMSNHSALQPLNPDRAREHLMRIGDRECRWQRGKCDTIVDRRGGGPTSRHTIPDPPTLPLKAEWQGGSGIHLSAIDHDGLILTVPELHVQFRTTPPPLKEEWQGGSRMYPQP
jgi:hypothetical protein